MSHHSDTKLMDEARRILQVLPKIGGQLPKELDGKRLAEIVKRFDDQLNSLVRLNNERTDAVNQKNDTSQVLHDFLKRVRSTVKGVFGDNSTEYQLVGGTRLSERKAPVRKPKAPVG